MEVRLATPQDAEELLEIYRYYVEHTAITFEYETPSITEFRQRIKQTLKRYPYLAAVDGHGKIVGYAYASSFKNRAAYNWSVETTIYVDKDVKRQGIGKKIIRGIRRNPSKTTCDQFGCVHYRSGNRR